MIQTCKRFWWWKGRIYLIFIRGGVGNAITQSGTLSLPTFLLSHHGQTSLFRGLFLERVQDRLLTALSMGHGLILIATIHPKAPSRPFSRIADSMQYAQS